MLAEKPWVPLETRMKTADMLFEEQNYNLLPPPYLH